MALLAGGLQALQSWLSQKRNKTNKIFANDNLAGFNKQLLYFFPIMVIIISWNLPAGIVVYWVATTLFSIAEQFYINRH